MSRIIESQGEDVQLNPARPALPPSSRTRAALRLTAAAAMGRFELQVCGACAAVQYPPREACDRCLSDDLVWTIQTGEGELLSKTALHHSHNPYFRQRLPWSVGMVKLDCGPTVIVHLPNNAPEPPVRLWVRAQLDRAGMGVLVGSTREDDGDVRVDQHLREFTSDPSGANILMTNGESTHSQALVGALVAAGASRIWVGTALPYGACAALDQLGELPQVDCLRLDVTDRDCVRDVAAVIGSEVDILINTAATAPVTAKSSLDRTRLEIDTHYLGLLNLAEYFGSAMRACAANGQRGPLTWVNVLSIFALSSIPSHRTWCASIAAAHSLTQSLRSEMGAWGMRVVNVFPGPLNDEHARTLQRPRLTPDALANAIIEALRNGVEDVYPGDVAREWLERLREDTKGFEREIASISGDQVV